MAKIIAGTAPEMGRVTLAGNTTGNELKRGFEVNVIYPLIIQTILAKRDIEMFSLELGDEVSNKTCGCCGEQYKSVTGFIKQDNDAYAVYFATLQTGHPEITVGLTVSIGKWWDDTALDERHWIYLTVKPSPENYNMRIEEPDRSAHFDFKPLGIALSREEALASSMKEDFFAVADYIVDTDPAVNSYLAGQLVNVRGRVCKH